MTSEVAGSSELCLCNLSAVTAGNDSAQYDCNRPVHCQRADLDCPLQNGDTLRQQVLRYRCSMLVHVNIYPRQQHMKGNFKGISVTKAKTTSFTEMCMCLSYACTYAVVCSNSDVAITCAGPGMMPLQNSVQRGLHTNLATWQLLQTEAVASIKRHVLPAELEVILHMTLQYTHNDAEL
jgi:hypothetical protein